MKLKVQLVICTDDSHEEQGHEVAILEKDCQRLEHLGLTLAEAKQLLATLQQALVARQAAGLWAISAGLSVNYSNDHEQLEIGMKLYDALYSWAKYAQEEIHTWNNRIE